MASNALHGKRAISAVEDMIGRELTYAERRVVEEEGFSPEKYLDTEGVETFGVGQTGEWIKKGFPAAFEHHVQRAQKYIPQLPELPEYLQAELIQAEYRGDLGGSPEFRKKFLAGDYEAAAEEFLDSDDYRKSKKEKTGVHKRMERVAEAVRKYGMEASDVGFIETLEEQNNYEPEEVSRDELMATPKFLRTLV